MKKLITMLLKRLFVVVFILFLLMIVVSGGSAKTNYVANISNIKSLQAVHIVQKYDNLEEELEVRRVANMQEAKEFGEKGPISFVGQMTSYGPDCVGCSGIVACPPRLDVSNNIYYEDNDYGTIRILAADRNIPCGSIMKISNLTHTDQEMIGIVLDRGGAIKGNIIDLLSESEAASSDVGREKDVIFEVVRWGW